jgi:phosphate transport system permease protein
MAASDYPAQVATAAAPTRLRAGPRLLDGDRLFHALVGLLAGLVVAFAALLAVYLVKDALPAFERFGAAFLWQQTWNPVTLQFGALPAIYGTLATSLLAMLLAVPVGVGAAIYLAEFAPPWVEKPLSFLIELLAAIPSVVIGLWGLFVLVPAIRPVQQWLGQHLGWLPLFSGPPIGIGVFAAGLVLAIMVLPILTAIVREVLWAVPTHQREAALALGATPWEMVTTAVLPYGRSGIVGAVILALGRALGETLAVTMVIGNAYRIDPSLFAQATTLASKIASEFREADSAVFLAALIYLALVLFAITLLVNLVARLLVLRLSVRAIGHGQQGGG